MEPNQNSPVNWWNGISKKSGGIISSFVVCSYHCWKKIDDYVFNGLVDAVIWSLGFIGAEQFASKIPAAFNRRGTYPGASDEDEGYQPQPQYTERVPKPTYKQVKIIEESEADMQ